MKNRKEILIKVKKKRAAKIAEAAILLMGTLGFWGFVYPELSMTETIEETQKEESFWERLGKEGVVSGDVRIKSRLFEYVYEGKGKEGTQRDRKHDQ